MVCRGAGQSRSALRAQPPSFMFVSSSRVKQPPGLIELLASCNKKTKASVSGAKRAHIITDAPTLS